MLRLAVENLVSNAEHALGKTPGAIIIRTNAGEHAHRRTGAPVALPARGGRHGHPVLFDRRVFAELMRPGLPQGARTVIHAHAADLAEVPVDALPPDLDTPEEYRRWRQNA